MLRVLSGAVWGVLAAVCGFSVLRDWQAWAIITTGVAVVEAVRIAARPDREGGEP